MKSNKMSLGVPALIFITVLSLWFASQYYFTTLDVTGRDVYNAGRICDTNKGLKSIEINLDGHIIKCHNGLQRFKNNKEEK